MESYTIEDIEVIRQKSGLSYQEAVALLDYHNGNLARALIDLERNGRLKDNDASSAKTTRSAGTSGNSGEGGFPGLLNRLLRFRLKISRNGTSLINLSVLFSALVIFIAPKLAAFSGILALLLGCNFAFDRNDNAFAGDDIQKMVRSAGENAKNSMNNVVKTFTGEFGGNSEKTDAGTQSAPVEKKAAQVEEKSVPEVSVPVQSDDTDGNISDASPAEKAVESYFAGNPAVAHGTAFSSSSVPTIQIPVQVETGEGNMSIESQSDGYSSLTID